ncbi:hypothetical protein BC938DRAFT_473499 [Jimgerdemannia flammicorona]|uniref:PH domain-containing protein n=1 Tax=Jimgerdemannia flammicorona TaxID=994334 RepID=A0A433Q3U7_9FUNG|nr:hypothetical protein BC938DRAFT_473499 [Jimgerdemannia flammicorona]
MERKEKERQRAGMQENESKLDKTRSPDERMRAAIAKLQEASIRRVTMRVYINDARNFKTLQLTSLMTTAMIIDHLKKRSMLDDEDDWALFELANDHGVERPLREWEIVTDVIHTWEAEKNALLAKKYAYKVSLTSQSVLNNTYPKLFGWLHHEYKKNKWQKRFFYVKDNGIYYAKDTKYMGETLLCALEQYDVYTLTRTLKKAPTKFQFALKSQDRARSHDNPDDYLHFLCSDHLEKMKDWVLSIRSARSQIQYERNPDRVKDPLAPVEPPPVSQAIIERTIMNQDFSGPKDWKIMRRAPSPPLQSPETMRPNVELPAPISSVLVPPRPNIKRNTPRALDHKTELSDDERTVMRRNKSQRSSPMAPQHPSEDVPLMAKPSTSINARQMQQKVAASALLSNPPMPTSPPTGSKISPTPSRSATRLNKPDNIAMAKLPGKPGDLPVSPIASPRSGDERSPPPHSFGATLIQIDNEVRFEKGSLLAQGTSQHRSDSLSRSNSSHRSHSLSRTSSQHRSESRAREAPSLPPLPPPVPSPGTTLIHIDDEIKFVKGSLLAKEAASSNGSAPMSRSKSRDGETTMLLSFETPRSPPPIPALQRKESMPFREPAVAPPVPPMPAPGKGLLQLDLNREQSHTQSLVERQVKPLVVFGREPDPVVVEKQRVEQREIRQREARELKKPLLAFDEFDKEKTKGVAALSIEDGDGKKKTVVGAEWRSLIG